MKTFYLITCLLMLALSQQVVSAQQPLAQQAFAIFEEHCLDCHGEFGSYTDPLLIKRAHLIVERIQPYAKKQVANCHSSGLIGS